MKLRWLNKGDLNIHRGGNSYERSAEVHCQAQKRDARFAKECDAGYQVFKFCVMLRMARDKAGVTQETIAKKLRTKKSAISRIENHSEDIRLSTLHRYAKALGKRLRVEITE